MSGVDTQLYSSVVATRHSSCCQGMPHRAGGLSAQVLTMEGISMNRNWGGGFRKKQRCKGLTMLGIFSRGRLVYLEASKSIYLD